MILKFPEGDLVLFNEKGMECNILAHLFQALTAFSDNLQADPD